MERSNFIPEEGDNADKPAAEKKKPGLIERFLKNKQQKSEVSKNDEAKEAQDEAPKSRLAKFAEQVLKLVRSEQKPEDQPKEELKEPVDKKSEKVPAKESESEAEDDPVIEKARDTRRFASKVLSLVMRVIGREEQPRDIVNRGKAEISPVERITPLKEAAVDLDQAIDELDNALPAPEANLRDLVEDNNATPSQTLELVNEGADWNPPKPEAATPKLPERPIEIKKPMTSKEKLLHNLAKSGLGFVALGSALALNRYYKKQKRELRDLKKFKQKQQEFNKVLQAKSAEQPYVAPKSAAKSQEQISSLSEFTHKQADITRETAEQVRQHESDKNTVREKSIHKSEVQNIEDATLSQKNVENRSVKSPDTSQLNKNESLAPLLTVESGDRIEFLPNNSQRPDDQTPPNQSPTSSPRQNSQQKQDQLRQTLADAGVDPDQHIPKHSDQPWLLTIALVLVVIIVVMAFILI